MKKLYSSFALIVILSITFVNEAKAVLYHYVGAGASITALTSWNTLANGTGVPPTSFSTAASNQWSITTSGTLTLSTTWTVSSNATIFFGDGTNPLTFFQLAPIATTTNNSSFQPTFQIRNNCTFVIGCAQAFNSARFNANSGSTVVYNSNSPSDLITTVYHNLTLNTNMNINFTSITLNGTLTINSGQTLNLNSFGLTANAIAGTGSFIGDNGGSSITLKGSGNVGTLNFAAGTNVLSGLTLSLSSATSSVTLGSDLSIDGSNSSTGLVLTTGVLNLNGHALSFDNGTNADFGSGTISGSSASSLLFNNISTFNNSLVMTSGANTLKALYLNGIGQTLTLGNSLNILDSITAFNGVIASGGNLTLKSTSALKARVGQMGPTGSITGNVTAEVFTTGSTTGWAQLGVGGVNGATIGSWDGQFPITCTGCTYGPQDVGDFFSIQGWNEDDPTAYPYDTTVTAGTALTPGEGFWVYLGASSASAGDITYSNTGSLVQGLVTRPATKSSNISDDGFNLMANPYACPISWKKLFDLNGGFSNFNSGDINIWDAEGSGTQKAFDQASDPVIPAGQGFFIEAFGNFTFKFDETVKTTNNTVQLQKTAAQDIVGFELHVDGSNGDADFTLFRFNNNASAAYDNRYDSHKLLSTPGYFGTGPVYSQYTTISSKINSDIYRRNTLPVLTSTMSVPVMVRVSASGTYSISQSDVQNFTGCALLKDKVTGLYHDLSVSPYVCTIADTTYAPRFELVLCEMNSTSAVTSIKQLSNSSGAIQIMQDEEGPLVATFFPQNTKATISVYNVVGQQLIKDLVIEGTETKTRLNVNSHNEVLLIKVTTDTETVTKKIITR